MKTQKKHLFYKCIFGYVSFMLMLLAILSPFATHIQNHTFATFAQNTQQETIFLLQPKQAVCTETETYVFDSVDSKIKVYTHEGETPTLRAENNVKTLTKPLVSMHTFSDFLVMLVGEESFRSLEILDMQTLQTVNVQDDDGALSRFADKTNITLVKGEDENSAYIYVLEQKNIYPYLLTKSDENLVVLKALPSYEITNTIENEPLQNIVCVQDKTFVATQSQVYMVNYNDGGYSCTLQPVSAFTLTQPALAALTIEDASYVVYVSENQGENVVSLYNITTQEITQTDISYATTEYMYGQENALLLTQDKTVQKYTFTLQDGKITVAQKDVASNAGFKTPPQEIWQTYENLQYATTTTTAQLYAYPFDAEPLANIAPQKFVTILTNQTVNNFAYCMYTDLQTNTNYYGYISMQQLQMQVPSPIKASFVTITSSQAVIYNLPSNLTDEHVQALTEVGNLTQGMQVTVLSKLANYYVSNDTQTKKQYFYLIQLPDGTKGFIRSASVTGVIVEIMQQQRVITNASVTENVAVYASQDGKNAFDTLQKGTRIKVIAQDTRNAYTLVVYNDANGNAITGYISTSAIHNDYLSTLQIIGIVLIVVNVILLGVFIYCKKRVMHD